VQSRRLRKLPIAHLVFATLISVLFGNAGLAVERQGERIQPDQGILAQDANAPAQKAQPQLDAMQTFMVKQVQVSGNTLITTDELLGQIPDTFNASAEPIKKAPQSAVYDFTELKSVIAKSGTESRISVRTIQGFTQYILHQYKLKHYAGIFVFVPNTAVSNGQLNNGVLPIQVIEGKVADVNATYYDEEQTKKSKGFLNPRALLGWSPVEVGKTIDQKKLNEYTNRLNQNPDRYVSPVISAGKDPQTLDVNYDVYEVNPWHFFGQVDNSGPEGNRWLPRVGVINTNLLGYDDIFTAIYQFSPESDWADQYSVYGSYDFPVFDPRLRFKVYGSYSEYDSTPAGGNIDFLGRGSFYGGELRYNLFQYGKWFFDVFAGLSHEESKTTPSIFPEFLTSDIDMDLFNYGVELHKRDRMSEASFGWEGQDMIGGSSAEEFALARTGAERDFQIYTTRVYLSRFLDEKYRIQRLSGTFKHIYTTDRLVPSKLTQFGGMYSVRGYEEYEILADEGVLASMQYEFDLVKYEKARKGEGEFSQGKKPLLRKLAPVAFSDFGESRIKDRLPGEDKTQTLWSVGPGLLAEVGEHVSGAVYWGFALKETEQTDIGDSRVNVSLLLRW